MLILGAGYLGAVLAELALADGHEVTLADNWYTTRPEQLDGLAARGARVVTADIRSRETLDELLADRPDRVYLLAAQTSRPVSEREPDYTEETNLIGVRRVAEAVAAAGVGAVVYASSLHVYGPATGKIEADAPYGDQSDLAHLSKVYSELCLRLYAERHGFDLSLLRLAIVYGPSPVEHEQPEFQTVIDKFRRLVAAGEPLTVDGGGRATIGAVHVQDAARILLGSPSRRGVAAANVCAESVTVADVAALARGERPAGGATTTYPSPFDYRHDVAGYLAR